MLRPIAGFILFAGLVATFAAQPTLAQEWKVVEDADWCDDERGWDETFCEVREVTLPANRDVIRVDGDRNGGIYVEGWDKNEILLRAKVRVWDRSYRRAAALAEDIEIQTGDVIHAELARDRYDDDWSVSYELVVPHNSNLSLETHNGGISIYEVSGKIEFDAHNGGVRLAGLSGDVNGQTRNGGVSVELQGSRWQGEGLDVQTTNGGVSLFLPEDYSAELITGTVNGGMWIDFPITIEGQVGKSIRTTLGDGGPRVRVTTRNGGVRIRKG